MPSPTNSMSAMTRPIYVGTAIGLAVVATLSVVIYRSAVTDAVAQRSTQQLTMVRMAAIGLRGELQGLSARLNQYNSIPSTQNLDVPVLAMRVNAAFSDNPNRLILAVVRIDADGQLHEWTPEGLPTIRGVPAVIDPDAWRRLADEANGGTITVSPVWWKADSPRQLRALVTPVWRTAMSDVHPVPLNDFNGMAAIVFDTRRLADVYLEPALADLAADDIVVGFGVADVGIVMGPSIQGVRLSANDVHDHPEQQGVMEIDDADGRRLHAWARFPANGESWIVAASSSYSRAASGIQRPAAGQLALTSVLLIAVPVAGWLLARRERRAQEDQRRLERELAGAQKIEAIGKLAGGVAHDFNNMLTAILGYASLIQEDAPVGSALRDQAGQIRQAADNAAVLTQKLLAFSRRQMLQANQFDFALMLDQIKAAIQRAIGDRATLTLDAEPGLWILLADSEQVQQALVDLALNANDAMPDGGAVSITARNLPWPERAPRAGVDVRAGDYVCIAVTDTGRGMDDATKARIFEPFFTTKRSGAGTGLGLATVYGFVKQCGGYVTVQSEPGSGTTMELLLPRGRSADDATPVTPTSLPTPASPTALETILVTEDEAGVRDLAVAILKRQGYQVLVAGSGEEALGVAAAFDGPIDLLLTDVVMPGLKGPDLARRLTAMRPATRVLLMSGYAAGVMTTADLDGMPLLAKPFSPGGLAKAVRAALGQSPLSSSPGPAA
mgnify:CR=1 FL=1